LLSVLVRAGRNRAAIDHSVYPKYVKKYQFSILFFTFKNLVAHLIAHLVARLFVGIVACSVAREVA